MARGTTCTAPRSGPRRRSGPWSDRPWGSELAGSSRSPKPLQHGAPGRSQLVCGSRTVQTYTRKKPSRIGLATRAGTGFTTSLLVSGQIALEISSGRDFLCGYRETDIVITMARFRTLSARRNAMISAAQCRSARALLGWSVAKLASAASVSASAIDDFEAERRAPIPAVAGSNARCSRNLMSRQSRPHAPGDLGMSVVLPRRIIA